MCKHNQIVCWNLGNIIRKKLYDYLEENQIFSETHGHRIGHPCLIKYEYLYNE